MLQMIDPSALGTASAAANSLHRKLDRAIQEENGLDLRFFFAEMKIKLLGLEQCSGKTIEHKSRVRRQGVPPTGHEFEEDLVRNQLPAFKEGMDIAAHTRIAFNFATQ